MQVFKWLATLIALRSFFFGIYGLK